VNIISRYFLIVFLLIPSLAFAAEAGHGPSLSGLFWRIGVFAVFFGIMLKILKPRIQAGLGAGVDKIVKAMNDAKKAHADSEKELTDYSQKLAGMSAELEQMKQAARVSAEKEAAMLVAEAQKAAEKYKELSARNISAELAKSRADLQRETVMMALGAAEAELAKDSDIAKKQQYIEKSIANIGAN
jgi:F0F1-type ATP synthase membrane subunit b/b'